MQTEIFITTIIPCFNEGKVLGGTVAELSRYLAPFRSYEIVLIDDGSTDNTWPQIIELTSKDERIHGLRLSRNYGHQAAISAGLAHSRGTITGIIDADMQDPPAVLVEMVKILQSENADVVFGIRMERRGTGIFYKFCYSLFYKLFSYLTGLGHGLEAGDFRVINRRVVNELNKLTESDKYVRGLIMWLGFKQIGFKYNRPQRIAGQSKYSFKKLSDLAISGITSFSIAPLRLAVLCACLSAIASATVAFWAIIDRYYLGAPPRGWASIIVVLLALGSIQFLILGVIGEYLGKVFLQSKNRPSFIVAERTRTSS